MPEPGIDDRDFDRPTTDRKKFRRRSKARVKLPGEYAEFRLSDGRVLRDVMGEGAFGPEGANGGKPITDSKRQRIRDGNDPLARMMRDESRFAPQAEAAGELFGYDGKVFSAAPSSTPGSLEAFRSSSNEGAPPESGFDISEAVESSALGEPDIAGVEQSRAMGTSSPPFEMSPPLPRVQARRDFAGGWWHGASRDGGTRQHNGVDLLAEPGTAVRSPIDGTVYRINYTASGMATITLRNGDGQEIKFLYVAPVDGQGKQLLEPGATVRAGQIIGSVEDLSDGYEDARTGRMKNHVHMRISENGQPVDPFPWLAQWWGNPEGSGKNWYPRRHSASPGIGSTPDYDAVSEGQRWRRERERR